MSHLTLYYLPTACSLAPHILAAHLSLPLTLIPMALRPSGIESADGTLSHSAYLKLHPAGYVPCLRISTSPSPSPLPSDTLITENIAIMTFLVAFAQDQLRSNPAASSSLTAEHVNGLFGKTAVGKAEVMEWLGWISGTLHGGGFAAMWRPARFTEDEAGQAAVKAKGEKVVRAGYERIERKLTGRKGCVLGEGEGVTVADVYLYVFWTWGAYKLRWDMRSLYPNYTELMAGVEGVQGVGRALDAEGIKERISV